MEYPLAGIKVLDFGQGGAGPYCGQLLGDFGADVIKIEPPRGDWSREMGVLDEKSGMTGGYGAVNRNKRSLCLDLKNPEAIAVVHQLVPSVDVVLESFRPGVMENFGLGYPSLSAICDAVIYCSVSGYGQSGPNVDEPASDSIMQAYSGLMSIVGDQSGPPTRVPVVVSDMLAATNAFASVLMALYQRATTGRGTRVGTSLLDSLIAFQALNLTEYLMTGHSPERMANRHPLIAASGVYEAADGYLSFAVLNHYWESFCRATDLTELVDDPRFAGSEARLQNRSELWAILGDLIRTRTVSEWETILADAGVLCSRVHDYAEVVDDPQVLHNQLLDSVSVSAGHTFPMVRSPMRVGDVSPRYGRPPGCGEHSRAILEGELGMSTQEVDRLVEIGAVYCKDG